MANELLLHQPDFSLAKHLRKIGDIFFNDSSTAGGGAASANSDSKEVHAVISELIGRLAPMKADLEYSLAKVEAAVETKKIPGLFASSTQGDGVVGDNATGGPILARLWNKYCQLAKSAARKSNLSTNKTSPTFSLYLCALVLQLYFLLEDMQAEGGPQQLKFPTVESFLQTYPEFKDYNADALQLYHVSANLISCFRLFVHAASNKTWIVQHLLCRITMARETRYKPGGGTKSSGTGRNKEFTDLLGIYEHEGNIIASEWSSKRREKRQRTTGTVASASASASASSSAAGADADGEGNMSSGDGAERAPTPAQAHAPRQRHRKARLGRAHRRVKNQASPQPQPHSQPRSVRLVQRLSPGGDDAGSMVADAHYSAPTVTDSSKYQRLLQASAAGSAGSGSGHGDGDGVAKEVSGVDTGTQGQRTHDDRESGDDTICGMFAQGAEGNIHTRDENDITSDDESSIIFWGNSGNGSNSPAGGGIACSCCGGLDGGMNGAADAGLNFKDAFNGHDGVCGSDGVGGSGGTDFSFDNPDANTPPPLLRGDEAEDLLLFDWYDMGMGMDVDSGRDSIDAAGGVPAVAGTSNTNNTTAAVTGANSSAQTGSAGDRVTDLHGSTFSHAPSPTAALVSGPPLAPSSPHATVPGREPTATAAAAPMVSVESILPAPAPMPVTPAAAARDRDRVSVNVSTASSAPTRSRRSSTSSTRFTPAPVTPLLVRSTEACTDAEAGAVGVGESRSIIESAPRQQTHRSRRRSDGPGTRAHCLTPTSIMDCEAAAFGATVGPVSASESAPTSRNRAPCGRGTAVVVPVGDSEVHCAAGGEDGAGSTTVPVRTSAQAPAVRAAEGVMDGQRSGGTVSSTVTDSGSDNDADSAATDDVTLFTSSSSNGHAAASEGGSDFGTASSNISSSNHTSNSNSNSSSSTSSGGNCCSELDDSDEDADVGIGLAEDGDGIGGSRSGRGRRQVSLAHVPVMGMGMGMGMGMDSGPGSGVASGGTGTSTSTGAMRYCGGESNPSSTNSIDAYFARWE